MLKRIPDRCNLWFDRFCLSFGLYTNFNSLWTHSCNRRLIKIGLDFFLAGLSAVLSRNGDAATPDFLSSPVSFIVDIQLGISHVHIHRRMTNPTEKSVRYLS